MRVVLDTNVFISGIFFSGPPAIILKSWANGRIQLLLSRQIVDEYQRVAKELALKFKPIDILPIIQRVAIHSQFVDTKGVNISACEDPDDNKFIECAIAGNCGIIISGDKHLLKLAGFDGIAVLKPRDFIEKYL